MNPHDATCPAPRKFRPAARIQWLLLLSIGLLSPLLQAADETTETPKGLAKSDWSSIRAAYEAGRHEIRATEGGHEARNPGLGWRTTWDGRGFLAQPASAEDGAWQWGLQLESYGFPGAEQKISQTAPAHTQGQHLTYQWDDNVQEWYVNDQRGVEHGFTVVRRPLERDGKDKRDQKAPAAATSLPSFESLPSLLSFQLSVRGGLHAAISPDAQTVRFLDAAGAAVVTYGGLKVWDADGKWLPAHFTEATADSFRLLVDERGARYPLTVDPVAQQAYFKASNAGAGDHFGHSVAVSANVVVVGAPYEDSDTRGVNTSSNENALDSGAAYVFTRTGSTWSQTAYLKASNTVAEDKFGAAVSISGNTIVVGAYGENNPTTTTGVSFGGGGGFGGDPPRGTALIDNSGAAYVFVNNGSGWVQQAYLKASHPQIDTFFGYSVSIQGDSIVVGAPHEASDTTGIDPANNYNAQESGGAYIFTRTGTTWTQRAFLKPSNTQAFDHFGTSVAMSVDQNLAVVGSPDEDSSTTAVNSVADEAATNAGAAYVFALTSGTWSQQAYLKSTNTYARAQFGFSVALAGSSVVVGAPNAGSAYIFSKSGSVWSQQMRLEGDDYSGGFGYSVAGYANTVVVGNPISERNSEGGAAFVFTKNAGVWAQQTVIGASNPGPDDDFGFSVAISGSTIVAGAPEEDSRAVSAGGGQLDNSAANAGASYVITYAPAAPIAITQSPTLGVIGRATLNGAVSAQDSATTIYFEYGLDVPFTPLIHVDATPAAISGNVTYNPRASVTGLIAGATYKFRVVASNNISTTFGNFLSFTMAGARPTLTPMAATFVSHNSAVLNGTVLANSSDTSVSFDYGPWGADLLQNVAASPNVVAGMPLTATPTAVSVPLTGLSPDTDYICYVRGTNAFGPSVSRGILFRTQQDPTAAGSLDNSTGATLIAGGSLYGTALQANGYTVLVGNFTSILGSPRSGIARLDDTGAVDLAFAPQAIGGNVVCAAVLTNGQILVGGNFTSIKASGTGTSFVRKGLALLNTDGSVDNSGGLGQLGVIGADLYVLSMAVQADGAILLGGDFTTINGTARHHIARITPAGVLDATFNPDADGSVYGIAVLEDGRVLIGGAFGHVSGAAHSNLARLSATTGAADASFAPSVNGVVYCIGIDHPGSVIVGGAFTNIAGVTRNHLARLREDGVPVSGFAPIVNNDVYSMALQSDGRIILGGNFTQVSGVVRNKVARVDTYGTVEAFNPNVTGGDVLSVGLRGDGKVMIAGTFTTVGSTGRNAYAQLVNGVGSYSVVKSSPDLVYWESTGTAPQATAVRFEKSTDGGSTYSLLGYGTPNAYARILQLSVSPALPGINNGKIRARARTASGYLSGSAGVLEKILTYNDPLATVTTNDPPTDITGNSAVIYGTINANGNPTDAYFQISETLAGLNTSQYIPAFSGSSNTITGSTNAVVSAPANSDGITLLPGHTYYYRAAGYNTGGFASGSAKTFTTLGNLQVDYKADGSDNSISPGSYVATGRNVNFTLARSLTPGTTLMVVNNTGSARITGQFANLTQGQTVYLNFGGISYPYVANYFGGTGNDLVLVWANTRAMAWGWDNGLHLGLGYQAPGGAMGVPTPVAGSVLAGKTILSMSAGFLHSMALCADGTLATWGYNIEGQLGDGSFNQQGLPTAVDLSFVPAGERVVAIAAGYNHSLALLSDGSVYAWGDNEYGQLGHGDAPNDSNVPTLVDNTGVLFGPGKNVIAIAAGARHCLAACEDGTIVAWGWGAFGQLGNGGTANQSHPVAINLSEFSFGFGEKVTLLAGGTNYSVAATNTGKLMAWGNNRTGQLGDGTTTQRTSPVLISNVWASGSPIVSLSAGGGGGDSDLGLTNGYYFSAARTASGRLAEWGGNIWGQLANGDLNLVQTTPLWLSDRGALKQSASGSGHVLAIANDDSLGAWGLGNEGRLGDGNVAVHVQPVPTAVINPLTSGERWIKVYGGPEAQHSLALVAGPPPPLVTTLAAGSITNNSVTLNGLVNANGNSASIFFQYGQDASYTVTTNVVATPTTLTGITNTPVSVALTGLTPGTIYHFRAAATAGASTATGMDVTFTTLGDPAIAGTVDEADVGTGFNGYIYATAEQPDGKFLVGGAFTQINGQPRNHLCRLNVDGSLDATFAPSFSGNVYTLSVLADGGIVVGGSFTTVNGIARQNLAKLSQTGTVDASFNPNVGRGGGFVSSVLAIAVQRDGKLVIGGLFDNLQPNGAATATTRYCCARINADGSLDVSFTADCNYTVNFVALQENQQIILGGQFRGINGQLRNYLGRVGVTGTPDVTFDPNPDGSQVAVAVQSDGSMIAKGFFGSMQPGGSGTSYTRSSWAHVSASGAVLPALGTDLTSALVSTALIQANGQSLLCGGFTSSAGTPGTLARVQTDGNLDPGLNVTTNAGAQAMDLLSNGKIILYGQFTELSTSDGPPIPRHGFARLNNSAATQNLTVTSGSRVQWLRGGSSPETTQVTFDLSTDGGTSYSPLGVPAAYGAGTRIPGGWELTGLSLPTNGKIRARARLQNNTQVTSSTGLTETLLAYSLLPPVVFAKPATDITDTTATLHAQVNANDNSTTVSFSYGLTNGWEIGTATATPNPVTGSGFTYIDGPIAGLLPGTTYHYTLTYGSSAGSGFTSDATFTTLTRLQAWRQLHFSSTANAGDGADLADPDNDGLSNLTEFAFGLHPLQPSANQLPELFNAGGQMIYQFLEPTDQMGLTYGAEWSPTMLPGSWLPLPDNGSGAFHSFKLSTTGLSRAFMRLRVTNTGP